MFSRKRIKRSESIEEENRDNKEEIELSKVMKTSTETGEARGHEAMEGNRVIRLCW